VSFIALALSGCSGCDESVDPPAAPVADLVLKNGRIFTATTAAWVSALAITDGVIVRAGDDASVGSGARVVDLGGRLVIPGLHDLHVHALEAGVNLELCGLDPGLSTRQYATAVADCAADTPGDGWVRAAGASIAELEGAELPVDALDRVVPDRPVMVLDDLGHSLWTNTLGLRAAGLTAATPDPAGGFLGRDNGRLDGLLFENAQHLIRDAAAYDAAVLDRGLQAGLQELARSGVTTISDAGGFWTQGHYEAWARAEQAEMLSVRAFNSLYLFPDRDQQAQLAAFRRMHTSDPERLLKFDSAKIYLDGILDLGTAAMLAPYDVPPDAARPRGLLYFEAAVLEAYARPLEAMGFGFSYHAIGDAAVRQVLDLAERVSGRHRVTHTYLVDPADRARFAALDVTADFQAGRESVSRAYAQSLRPMIGARADGLIPIRALLETKARVVLSSDWDADVLEPFAAIARVVDKGVSVTAAVKMHTVSAAEALGHIDRVGTLEVGKMADLIVVDRDVFAVPHAQIGDAEVLWTLLEGEEVYRNPAFTP